MYSSPTCTDRGRERRQRLPHDHKGREGGVSSVLTMIELVTRALAPTVSDSGTPPSPWAVLTFVIVIVVLTVGGGLLLGADRRRTYKLLLEHTPPNTTLVDTGCRGQQVICARGGDGPVCLPAVLTEGQLYDERLGSGF